MRKNEQQIQDKGINSLAYQLGFAKLFMALMLIVITASCSEEKSHLPEDEVLLSLSFNMTEESELQSRALSSTIETTLSNIRVLVFKVDGGVETFAYEAAIVSTSPFKILVRKSKNTEKYRLVLLINATIPIINEGANKSDALKSMTFDANGKWKTNSDMDYTPIPMWGETTTAEVITESTTFQAVSLLRALARIDVGLKLASDGESATGLSDFMLTSVSVYCSNNKGYVAPVDATLSGGSVSEVSIPTGTTLNPTLTYIVSDGKTLIRTIYLAEVAAGTTKKNALCLVIGGKYNGSAATNFYRVDIRLANGQFAPIKRNCQYRINIISVGCEGYATEGDALSGDKNIIIGGSVTVNDWVNGTGNSTTVTL